MSTGGKGKIEVGRVSGGCERGGFYKYKRRDRGVGEEVCLLTSQSTVLHRFFGIEGCEHFHTHALIYTSIISIPIHYFV